MQKEPLSRLESYIEGLVEGAFANLFRENVTLRNLALQLARAMQDNLRYSTDSNNPVAPSRYTINAGERIATILQERYDELVAPLDEYLQAIATDFGYALLVQPKVELIIDPALSPKVLVIQAEHDEHTQMFTSALTQVQTVRTELATQPQLIINGHESVELTLTTINIGRSEENDIVLNDPHVSRHHIQLRRRDGSYMLFDTQSRGGTFVNNVSIRQHQLQCNDVIRIGNTQLLYVCEPEIHTQTIPLDQED